MFEGEGRAHFFRGKGKNRFFSGGHVAPVVPLSYRPAFVFTEESSERKGGGRGGRVKCVARRNVKYCGCF